MEQFVTTLCDNRLTMNIFIAKSIKRLAGENVSDMTHFVSSGMKIFNQSITEDCRTTANIIRRRCCVSVVMLPLYKRQGLYLKNCIVEHIIYDRQNLSGDLRPICDSCLPM